MIESGPAGLTAANDLSLVGFEVTVIGSVNPMNGEGGDLLHSRREDRRGSHRFGLLQRMWDMCIRLPQRGY